MKFTKGRLFLRQKDGCVMLLGIVLGELPSLLNEHLHDVNIIDDDGCLTMTVERSGLPARGDISSMRADQILTGAFRMANEEDSIKGACKEKGGRLLAERGGDRGLDK